jgi:2-oxoglutarate dehydrogenase E2 component (dihydrolipoamide succinyltransferase)
VIETDKVTLEVVAEADGILAITVAEGQTVAIGTVVGTIDAEAAPKVGQSPAAGKAAADKEATPEPGDAHKPEAAEAGPPTAEAEISEPAAPQPVPVPQPSAAPPVDSDQLAPSVRRLVAERNLDLARIIGTGPNGRITKGDVLLYLESGAAPVSPRVRGTMTDSDSAQAATELLPATQLPAEERITRTPMRRPSDSALRPVFWKRSRTRPC